MSSSDPRRAPSGPTAQEAQYLDLLSIFHYVVAGLVGLFALFPILHFGFGIWMMVGEQFQAEPPAKWVGALMTAFAGLWILAGFTMAVLLVRAGRFLGRRERHRFCLVVAGISCVVFPFGTVLGVLTLILLVRPSVQAAFGEGPKALTGAGPDDLEA